MEGPRDSTSWVPPHTVRLVGGEPVMWDGRPWTIANVGAQTTTLVGTEGRLVTLPTARLDTLLTQGHLVGVQPSPRVYRRRPKSASSARPPTISEKRLGGPRSCRRGSRDHPHRGTYPIEPCATGCAATDMPRRPMAPDSSGSCRGMPSGATDPGNCRMPPWPSCRNSSEIGTRR
jgi:hypothetical protein